MVWAKLQVLRINSYACGCTRHDSAYDPRRVRRHHTLITPKEANGGDTWARCSSCTTV